jgi:predicted HTH transcriptional regulator
MKLRVFISSVQKELADERLAIQTLITTDPFLSEHCVPVLFDQHPAPLTPKPKPYLDLLDECNIYLCILWNEYGLKVNGLSATHREYRHANSKGMPILLNIKGPNTLKRPKEISDFITEIKEHHYTYARFKTSEELQNKVRDRLIRHIKDHYDIEPTNIQDSIAHQTIKVASSFERQRLDQIEWDDIDHSLTKDFVSKIEENPSDALTEEKIMNSLYKRGFFWRDENGQYFATAAGILFFAKDPSIVFPHARIQILVFHGTERSSKPDDKATIRKPILNAIDESVEFIQRNIRHPLRIVGLNRVKLDEYPKESVREALINALVHRDYEDAGRRIRVEIFKDRIEIISPGNLPGNLTLTKLSHGKASPRSRNPIIAQAISQKDLMEERGTGILRMREHMLNHGLDIPTFRLYDDELIVTLHGPGDNLDCLRTPSDVKGPITPAIESKLNERQRKIIHQANIEGKITSGWCSKAFGITRETAVQDLKGLTEVKLLMKKGKGRGVHYVLYFDHNE